MVIKPGRAPVRSVETPWGAARRILTRSGITASVYTAGAGDIAVNGFPTRNYTLSDGSTGFAAVDGPVGLVLDGMGSLGAELVTVTPVFTSIDASFVASTSGGVVTAAANGTLVGFLPSSGPLFVGGNVYEITVNISSYISGAVSILFFGGATESQQITATTTFTIRLDAGATGVAYLKSRSAGTTLTVSSISVKQVTGIHATQPTTSDKCTLKQTSGRYNWLFDATDTLTATYPAGYESVTVIDSKSTGQETSTAVNVVGAYSMGPSVTLYGRIIVKGALSASELATLQRYANSLAGL